MNPTTARPANLGINLLLAALLATGSFFAIHVALYEPGQSPVLADLRMFLGGEGEPGTDSWAPMRAAYAWIEHGDPGTVYQHLFFDQQIKFQYPPSSLLIFSALNGLGVPPTDALFDRIGWFAILVTVTVVSAQATIMLRRNTAEHSVATMALAAGLAAFVTLTFYPILRSYALGQAQSWINAAFALAVLCWLLDRRVLAGVLIGLICTIKPQFALFAVWGLLRRHWGFTAGMTVVGIPATISALALYGLANHIDYVNVLQFLTRHSESFVHNQSIAGLLHRLHDGGYLEWHQGVFPPYVPFIYATTLLTSAVIVAGALFVTPRAPTDHLLDFLAAALSFTLAAPVAWGHHFGILPPIFVALFFQLMTVTHAPARVFLALALGVAFVFAANFFPFTYDGDGWASMIHSHLLIAALAVLAILYQLRLVTAVRAARLMGDAHALSVGMPRVPRDDRA